MESILIFFYLKNLIVAKQASKMESVRRTGNLLLPGTVYRYFFKSRHGAPQVLFWSLGKFGYPEEINYNPAGA